MLLGCRGAHALDINAYRLLEQPIAPQPYAEPGTRIWMNALQFVGSRTVIPLSRSKTWPPPEPRQYGFSPRSLRINWLDRGHLLHIEWGTLPTGGDNNFAWEGHVVLLVDGDRLHEIFRTVFQQYGRVGAGNDEYTRLRIAYDARRARLRFTELDEGSISERELFYQWNHRTVWQYRLRGRRLQFLRADQYAIVATERCSLAELARTLEVPQARLERLNPHFAPRAVCEVRIDDRVKALRPSHEDGIE
ncbi:MAG: hypothetical protein SF182_15090 [Deltaproteobacteria bacterium]|nr:hypothetical protein [Deltaproteobacteria bacterium]